MDQTSWGSNIKIDELEQFRYNFFNTLQKEEEKKIGYRFLQNHIHDFVKGTNFAE